MGGAEECGLHVDAGVASEAVGTVCSSAYMGERGGPATYSGNPESFAGQGEAGGGCLQALWVLKGLCIGASEIW